VSDNLYQRGKTWYGRREVRGTDIRRSLRTTSRSVAQARLKRFLDELEHLKFHGENRHTWKTAVVEWAKAGAGNIAPGTLKRYLVSLKQLRPFLDDLYVDEIGRKKIAEIARRAGVTNATRRRDLTAVSVVLRWAVSQGWREDNPARDWDRGVIQERRTPIVLPREEDVAAVVAAAPGNFSRMIVFARQTGMREEECASLERPEVDLKRRAVGLSKTKTNRPRSVPLSDAAVGTISGTPIHLKSGFVFWHGNGARYANVASRFAAIVGRVKAAAEKSGKPFRPFRFHDLRHLFAVEYLRAGGSIYDLQKILGHTSVKTTEIYLLHLTPEEQDAAKSSAQKPAQV
jgi:integrase/recombinase XerD